MRLASGQAHVVEVRAARRAEHVVVPAAAFALGSAFPTPGARRFVQLVHARAEQEAAARLVVLGHTDRSGSDARNKDLSDRRARAIYAMVARDLAAFDAVAEDDGWGVVQYQAMLRGVGCNPGAIDGEPGELTRRAVAAFQREYDLGEYHRAEGAPSRRAAGLAVDGRLGPETRAALRDAYLAGLPRGIARARFAGPRHAGCSEFNPRSAIAAENRRVGVAFLVGPTPADGDFPCRDGEAAACPVEPGPGVRCPFYRAHFGGSAAAEAAPPFFDFQWLGERSGHVHMSALTWLPDSGDVRFVVSRWREPLPERMPSSAEAGGAPPPVEDVAVVAGRIRCGVAFARWKPPPAFHPLDHAHWLVDHDLDVAVHDGNEDVSIDDLLRAPAVLPPVFRIEAGDAWGYARPPGVPIDQIRLAEGAAGEGLALCEDGSVVRWTAKDGAAEPGEGHPPAMAVFALGIPQRRLLADDDGGEPA